MTFQKANGIKAVTWNYIWWAQGGLGCLPNSIQTRLTWAAGAWGIASSRDDVWREQTSKEAWNLDSIFPLWKATCFHPSPDNNMFIKNLLEKVHRIKPWQLVREFSYVPLPQFFPASPQRQKQKKRLFSTHKNWKKNCKYKAASLILSDSSVLARGKYQMELDSLHNASVWSPSLLPIWDSVPGVHQIILIWRGAMTGSCQPTTPHCSPSRTPPLLNSLFSAPIDTSGSRAQCLEVLCLVCSSLDTALGFVVLRASKARLPPSPSLVKNGGLFQQTQIMLEREP